jgi:2-methylfumaryl-CoA hydratase
LSKQQPGNFFEDFRLGQTIRHATPRTISDGEAALYIGLTGSRFPLHSADTVAQAQGLPRRNLDDLLAFHVAFGKTVPDVSLNAVANLGYADVHFSEAVYAGDTLRAESEVIGLKENANGKTGIVYVRSRTFNQNEVEVMRWVRWVMVHKRDAAAPAPETVVPELPAFVAPEALSLPDGLTGVGYDVAATGAEHLWDDYSEGERIDHVDGLTVDESDHTLATKLYQNTAKVHFDAHAMQSSRFGKRLMYGGHVISVCRALSFNGLANAVRIAAINGGAHANPSFAGDTFYAYSEVLNKWELPGRSDLGALRLRTVGVKNIDTRDIESPKIDVEGKQRYRDEVVLDLDYTVLMPRR